MSDSQKSAAGEQAADSSDNHSLAEAAPPESAGGDGGAADSAAAAGESAPPAATPAADNQSAADLASSPAGDAAARDNAEASAAVSSPDALPPADSSPPPAGDSGAGGHAAAVAMPAAPAANSAPVAPQPRRGFIGKIIDFFEDDDIEPSAPKKPKVRQPAQLKPSWYYWIFFASGFAGLIYESIWARYLKLFLGHAAYAQALVLGIFLFGLAAGAALCARYSTQIKRPLLWYAGIEVLVALTAVYFHEVYVAVSQWAINFVMPQIESDSAAELFKWLVAALLILPQSVLLGATFPLMSAGVTRLWKPQSGRIIAMLYFSNSLGAVFGVLASGFVLLPLIGLPGTVAFAGLINTAAAAAVWILGHMFDDEGSPISADARQAPTYGKTVLGADARLTAIITAAAFTTGLASFIYEIVWIRMLALLLGSSTHTFEIVLAVFILGLALGGLYARRFADSPGGDLLALVGKVQLAMGALALWSLFCFPLAYDIIYDTLRSIPRDDAGYLRYQAISFGLCALMMLPSTFCAGMTLPLLTRRLLNSGGESAVGQVYAANTLGAITGVFITLHILLPQAGMQHALLIGAFIDMLLGVALIGAVLRARAAAAFAFMTVTLAVSGVAGGIDKKIASAGVFRHQTEDPAEVVYYRDGKTASIAVVQGENRGETWRAIKTNGKSDATIRTEGAAMETGYGADESTMMMLGLLPLLYKPEAKQAMNIGFGAGLTSRALLLSRNLKQLDNVEIEAAVIEGARLMSARTEKVFDDPRNRFIINDAKSVMARAPRRYDIIVSEPSNPWVSGVAGLFSREFYQQAHKALKDDGVFVQWLPLYETEPRLVASVAQALGEVFADFHVYAEGANLIFIASAQGTLPQPLNAIFASDEARAFFTGYGIRSAEDLKTISLGDKKILLPYFESFQAPVNSDYYPFLENNAQRAFFNNARYVLDGVLLLPVAVLPALGNLSAAGHNVKSVPYSAAMRQAALAHEHYDARLQPEGAVQSLLSDLSARGCPVAAETAADDSSGSAEGAAEGGGDAQGFSYLEQISTMVTHLAPGLDKQQMREIWQLLEQDDCVQHLLASTDSVPGIYTQFWRALSLRDSVMLIETTDALLPYANAADPSGQTLLLAAMAAHYQQENYQKVLELMLNLPPTVDPVIHHAARLLAANAAEKI